MNPSRFPFISLLTMMRVRVKTTSMDNREAKEETDDAREFFSGPSRNSTLRPVTDHLASVYTSRHHRSSRLISRVIQLFPKNGDRPASITPILSFLLLNCFSSCVRCRRPSISNGRVRMNPSEITLQTHDDTSPHRSVAFLTRHDRPYFV